MAVIEQKPPTHLPERKSHASAEKPRTAGRLRAAQVADALDKLCITLGPGGRLPTHTELMDQFGASERAVREALDALHRSGRIVRRQRAGTFVTDQAIADVENTPVAPLPASLTGEHSIVAVAASDHSFFDRSVDLFCRHAEVAGFSPICKPIRDPAQIDITEFGRSLLDANVAGFILFSHRLEPLARYLHENGARVVLFATPPSEVALPYVGGDQDYGGYLLVEHLIQLGHRRLGFSRIHDSPRWQGAMRAIEVARRAGLAVEGEEIGEETTTWIAEPSRAAAYLRRPDAPTALLCWNDENAARLLSTLSRAGVRVPEEVSLAGYDNLPESELVHPTLTTIDPATDQMVRIAIDLIYRGETQSPSRTLLIPSLVVRESTAPPRTG